MKPETLTQVARWATAVVALVAFAISFISVGHVSSESTLGWAGWGVPAIAPEVVVSQGSRAWCVSLVSVRVGQPARRPAGLAGRPSWPGAAGSASFAGRRPASRQSSLHGSVARSVPRSVK